MARQFGSTLQALKELRLDPRGGELTPSVVVEGPVSSILEALQLPGVEAGLFDEPLSIARPAKNHPTPTQQD